MQTERQNSSWLSHALTVWAEADPASFEEFVARLRAELPDDFESLSRFAAETERADENWIHKDERGVARIRATQVAVWEVVRTFRTLGSVEELKAKFVVLTEGELRAALAYAGQNPDEISAQINRYEEYKQSRPVFGTT
jgi:uncharacterized protein (DUF433 family)